MSLEVKVFGHTSLGFLFANSSLSVLWLVCHNWSYRPRNVSPRWFRKSWYAVNFFIWGLKDHRGLNSQFITMHKLALTRMVQSGTVLCTAVIEKLCTIIYYNAGIPQVLLKTYTALVWTKDIYIYFIVFGRCAARAMFIFGSKESLKSVISPLFSIYKFSHSISKEETHLPNFKTWRNSG